MFNLEKLMLKVKLGMLVDAKDSLETIGKEPLSSVQRKNFYKVYNKATDEIAIYEKIYTEKAQELGNKNENGTLIINDKNMIGFTQENGAKFLIEINSLRDIEIELEGDQLNIDELDIKMSAHNQKMLKWLFI